MTEANYWFRVCEVRSPNGKPVLSDRVCRALVSEAAMPDPNDQPLMCGIDGRMWRFADGSSLILNANGAVVR